MIFSNLLLIKFLCFICFNSLLNYFIYIIAKINTTTNIFSILYVKNPEKETSFLELLSQAFVLKVWHLILTKCFAPLGPDFFSERTEP